MVGPMAVIAISRSSRPHGVAVSARGRSCSRLARLSSTPPQFHPSGRVAAASQACVSASSSGTSASATLRVIGVEPGDLVGGEQRRSISRRSIGASVSVSKALSGFSAPADRRRFHHQHQVLDADAVGAGLVIAGLVREDHAALERRRAELGDARRAFVHRQIAADAVAGAVVVSRAPPPTAPAGRTGRAARRWCRRETPRGRWRYGP